MTKIDWWAIPPKDAVDIRLPHPDIQGPYGEDGEECPWPWDPIQLKGAPLGMYHCSYCGSMCMAGMEHVDYGPKDENGLTQMDRDYIEEMKRESESDEANDDDSTF